MKYGAGSDFAREVLARSSSDCMVERRTPSPLLSAGGALQARIPVVAIIANNRMNIESRNRFMGVLDVRPPAFDRCQTAVSRWPLLSERLNRLIMPGIDSSGKRFYIALIQ